VTGVHAYGAFVDVGVGKDGLLRCAEVEWLARRHVHDMRDLVSVGDTLPMLFVLDYDEGQGRLTLTTRPPPEAVKEARPHAAPASRLGESATTSTGAGAGRGKAATASAKSCVNVGKEGDVRRVPAKQAPPSPQPQGLMRLDATTVGAHSGETVLQADWQGPTAVAVLCGEDAVPRVCVDKPPREVIKVRIQGAVHILYDLPWKGASVCCQGLS